MRQDLPIRIKEGGNLQFHQLQPGLHILLEGFLLLKITGDENNRSFRFPGQ